MRIKKPGEDWADHSEMQWQTISTAPFDRDLELAVRDYDGTHALVFPCRRVLHGWINVETKKLIEKLRPTHWREWPAFRDKRQPRVAVQKSASIPKFVNEYAAQ